MKESLMVDKLFNRCKTNKIRNKETEIRSKNQE